VSSTSRKVNSENWTVKMKSTVLLLCLMVEAIFGSPLYTVLIPYIHQSPIRQMLPVEPVVVDLETAYECTKEGSFADLDSCDSYYVCITTPEGGLKAHIINCPPGLEFNTKKNICDWPTGSCQLQGDVASCDSLKGEARRLCQERLAEIPQEEQVIIELGTEFECSKSGIFSDPNSCNKYYSCNKVKGKLEVSNFDCPSGLMFNAKTKNCDLADNVDCTVQEQIDIDVCSSPGLTEEQKALCQSNAWKHTDHF